jgi:hypothetical protein
MTPGTAINKFKTSLSREGVIVAILLLIGGLLRLRQYLAGRSLWADEAMLALNIVNRNFGELLKPLDYDQGAPIGFLLVEKLFNSILGKNELALRLFPLLVGLLALWLFYSLLKRTTRGIGLILALALFVFNPRLVYYSSEVKQYIVDVAVTLALLLIAAPCFRTSARRKDFLWLTFAGLFALWFSHPAVFVLAGIGFALAITSIHQRDISSLRLTIGMGVIWLLNIGVLYWLVLKDLSQNTYMREYWQSAFVPLPPWSDPGWFLRNINETISTQFGLPYAITPVFILLFIGWFVLFRSKQEYAITFACVSLMVAIASAFQFYPAMERMILFLIPLGLLLLGKAVESLYRSLREIPFLGAVAAVLLAGYLVYGPLMTSYQAFRSPKYFEHIRPSMEVLRETWKSGDALYVSQGGLAAFRFYASFYGLDGIPYEFGQREDYKDPPGILRELDALQGRSRVWILLSHVYENGDFNEKDFLLNYLNQVGEKKREFRMPGTSVFLYLYDLKK